MVPSAVFCAVLATPIVRLLYQHGHLTAEQVPGVAHSVAAFSVGLAANGVMLLLNRSFFSLQSPWLPTAIAIANLGLNVVLMALLWHPFGVWGIPLATSISNLVAAAGLWLLLHRRVGDIEFGRCAATFARTLVASGGLAVAAYGAWLGLDTALGRSDLAQGIAIAAALTAGALTFFGLARLLRMEEARFVTEVIGRRFRRR